MSLNYRCAHRWAFTAWGGPLQELQGELPPPTGREVTVRITHCGICHSDLHVQAGASTWAAASVRPSSASACSCR